MKTEFKKGDIVICVHSYGYLFTTGKEYVIIEYDAESSCPDTGFTWPDYVSVKDDNGKIAYCHAHRFKLK